MESTHVRSFYFLFFFKSTVSSLPSFHHWIWQKKKTWFSHDKSSDNHCLTKAHARTTLTTATATVTVTNNRIKLKLTQRRRIYKIGKKAQFSSRIIPSRTASIRTVLPREKISISRTSCGEMKLLGTPTRTNVAKEVSVDEQREGRHRVINSLSAGTRLGTIIRLTLLWDMSHPG